MPKPDKKAEENPGTGDLAWTTEVCEDRGFGMFGVISKSLKNNCFSRDLTD